MRSEERKVEKVGRLRRKKRRIYPRRPDRSSRGCNLPKRDQQLVSLLVPERRISWVWMVLLKKRRKKKRKKTRARYACYSWGVDIIETIIIPRFRDWIIFHCRLRRIHTAKIFVYYCLNFKQLFKAANIHFFFFFFACISYVRRDTFDSVSFGPSDCWRF